MFAVSRTAALARILLLPAAFVSRAAEGAFYGAQSIIAEVREDLFPAIRFVMTGDDTEGSIVRAVSALKDRVVSFWMTQVFTRLVALTLLLLTPIMLAAFAIWVLCDEEFFGSFWDATLDLAHSVLTGRDPFRL